MQFDTRWFRNIPIWIPVVVVIYLLFRIFRGSLPMFIYWPFIAALTSAGLFISCALLATPDVRNAFAEIKAFIPFILKKHGRKLAVLLGLYTLLYAVVDFVWSTDNSDWIGFINDGELTRRFIMRVALFGSAMLLGALAGNAFPQRSNGETPATKPQPRLIRYFEGTVLSALIDRYRLPWRFLANIAAIPVILSVVLVIGRFQTRGSFYGDFSIGGITNLEWVSDQEIVFRSTGTVMTDCVGCVPVFHAVEKLDVQSGTVTRISMTEEDWPGTWKSGNKVAVSPDGTRKAYVANGIDIYVQPVNGIPIGWPVYLDPYTDFVTRYAEEILTIFIVSLLVAPVLAIPWLWRNRQYPEAFRMWAAIALWCIPLYLGSLDMRSDSMLNIVEYIFIPIP